MKSRKKRSSPRYGVWLLLLAAAIGIGIWWVTAERTAAPQTDISVEPPRDVIPPAPQTEATPPAVRHPIEEAAVEAKPESSLPGIDESDPEVSGSLAELAPGKILENMLRNENVVRNIVVTVDNLPRQKVAARLLPLKPIGGPIATQKVSNGTAIADANAARYTPYVLLAEQIDAKQLVELYVRLYPLFQRAYEELGFPDAYFNDRLIEVIDHMLAAPAPESPILLKQPHILYQFADPQLESSSAGHKLMIRMGKENADRLKAKMQEIRTILTNRQPS